MAKTITKTDTTAADTSIGFDYQFYYFFYLILELRHEESIGLEVKDDVHVEFADGRTLFIQTKHSVQSRADGEIINLTERDVDLWKTLSIWANAINSESDKKAFVQKSRFQLITNKSNASNPFIAKVVKTQVGDNSIEDFMIYVKSLLDKTSDLAIKGYMKAFLKVPKTILQIFIGNLQFDLREDNLIDRIKTRLLEKIHISEKINDVYDSLHSALRDHNYLKVKKGESITISFDEFNKKFKNCFKAGLSTKLPIREVHITIPEDPSKQIFVKQLIDIGDLLPSEKERMIELTTHLLKLYNNLKEWEAADGLLPSTKSRFNKNTILIWTNSFRSSYREVVEKFSNGTSIADMEEEIKRKALECLDEMRKQILTIDDTQLDTELSNGQFYLLTEEKSIGWHFEWEKRYK